ncbi:hypothetical protein K435DRAFT_473847 [Dendrothele bispora CBS 962.96]|uniref:Uncharacterized protein n=1 Tax=Dendrothele bispora (strain CBS 962.96) TaxID=1314807 RepID=A0A4V4HGR9_DENBC|nr:hypothetical protein K435DRAFT_473847 [Dendrothele bispora CBS 962.96]
MLFTLHLAFPPFAEPTATGTSTCSISPETAQISSRHIQSARNSTRYRSGDMIGLVAFIKIETQLEARDQCRTVHALPEISQETLQKQIREQIHIRAYLKNGQTAPKNSSEVGTRCSACADLPSGMGVSGLRRHRGLYRPQCTVCFIH